MANPEGVPQGSSEKREQGVALAFIGLAVLVADLLPKSDKQKKSLLSFVKDYQNHYKAEGDHFGGHAWDAVMLLKGAIERGGDSPVSIRDQLEKTRHFAGIGGIFNYSPEDHSGLNKDAFVLVEIKNRDWVLVK